jgi:hypothetical protein
MFRYSCPVSRLPLSRTEGLKVCRARIMANEAKFARHFKGLVSIGNVRVRSSDASQPLSQPEIARTFWTKTLQFTRLFMRLRICSQAAPGCCPYLTPRVLIR